MTEFNNHNSIMVDGKLFIGAKFAARELGYTQDYIGQLVRKGAIGGKLLGRTWYVDLEALKQHKLSKLSTQKPEKPTFEIQTPSTPAPAIHHEPLPPVSLPELTKRPVPSPWDLNPLVIRHTLVSFFSILIIAGSALFWTNHFAPALSNKTLDTLSGVGEKQEELFASALNTTKLPYQKLLASGFFSDVAGGIRLVTDFISSRLFSNNTKLTLEPQYIELKDLEIVRENLRQEILAQLPPTQITQTSPQPIYIYRTEAVPVEKVISTQVVQNIYRDFHNQTDRNTNLIPEAINKLQYNGTLYDVALEGATITLSTTTSATSTDFYAASATVDSLNIGALSSGLTIAGAGSGITFTGTGDHDISASAGTLRLGSNVVIGNIEALDDTIDIGTPGVRFDKFYANEVNATTLVGTLTGGNLLAETFSINSDNATADTEDGYLVFERGTEIPNAIFKWDSTNDEFDFNFGINISGNSTTTNATTTNSYFSNSLTGPGNFIVNSSGNVGVGTTTPAQLLSVGGSLFIGASSAGGTSGGLGVGTVNTSAGSIVTTGTITAGNTINLGSGASGGILSWGGSSPLLRAAVGGNVNIQADNNSKNWIFGADGSTTFPSGAVSGITNIGLTGTIAMGNTQKIYWNTDSSKYLSYTESGTIWNLAGGHLVLSSDKSLTTPTIYGGTGASQTLTVRNTSGNANNIGIDIGSVYNSDNGGISFFTAGASTATERVRIEGTTGDVGIGTTDPAARLDILESGNSGNQLRLYDSEGVTPGIRTYSTSDGYGLILNSYYAVGGSPYVRYADIVASAAIAVEATEMRFFTKASNSNPAEALRIDSSGYVGIGTTDPQSLLHLRKDQNGNSFIRVENQDTSTVNYSSQAGIAIYGGGGAWVGSLKSVEKPLDGFTTRSLYLTTESNIPLAFGINQSATPSMVVSTTGNIGIGTSTPQRLLSLSSAAATRIGFTRTTSYKEWFIGTDTSPAGFYLLHDQTSNATRIFVSDAGDVGIGTTTPSAGKMVISRGSGIPDLELSSGTAADSYGIGIRASGGSSSSALRLMSSVGTVQLYDGGVNSYSLNIYNTGGLGISLNSNSSSYFNGGNVGFGTTTPQFPVAIQSNSGANALMIIGRNNGTTDEGTITFTDNDGVTQAGFQTQGSKLSIFAPSGVGVSALTAATANHICYDTTTISGYNTFSTCSSLRELKTNIESQNEAMSTIMALNPVSFNNKKTLAPQYGFIAEEVNAVDPILSTFYQGKLNGVDYDGITSKLVKAMQEVNLRVQDIEFNLQNASTSLTVSTSTPGLVAAVYEAIGATIENGILYIKTLLVDKLIAKNGVVIYDRITGEPICSVFENGQPKYYPGDCSNLPSASSQQGGGQTTSSENTPSASTEVPTESATTTEPVASTTPETTPTPIDTTPTSTSTEPTTTPEVTQEPVATEPAPEPAPEPVPATDTTQTVESTPVTEPTPAETTTN